MITRGVTLIAILAVSLFAAAFATEAQQQAGKVPRIGVLTSNPMTAALQEAFRQGLRDHAYVEGQNILVEWRAAEGRTDRAQALAEELVGLKVDVIVAIFTPAVRAAKAATSTIPVVMAPAGAPVATGLVASLARPGGNITGIAGLDAELQGKRIELLRELIPSLTHVGLLINAADPFAKPFVDEAQVAAKRTGVQIHIVDVRRPQEIDAAFAASIYPKLLFVAEPGALVSPAFAEKFVGTLQHCAVVGLGAGKHYLQEDHPEAIGRSVAGWIAGIEAVTSGRVEAA